MRRSRRPFAKCDVHSNGGASVGAVLVFIAEAVRFGKVSMAALHACGSSMQPT
jgi:hypothetical protein